MPSINFVIHKSDIGAQLVDGFHAYLCSKEISLDIKIQNSINKNADLNIFFTSMPTKYINTDQYDIVLYSNAGEPVGTATEVIKKNISNSNTYFIANSFLTKDHPLYNKVICWPDPFCQTRTYWTQYFYKYYFNNNDNTRREQQKNKIAYINGQNRTVRHNFFKHLTKIKNIDCFGSYGNNLYNTNISFFESTEDCFFRQELEVEEIFNVFCNTKYTYHDDKTYHGIDGKFGTIPPGYEILEEYYKYACIVFPESSWQNNELAITEKALKCFYTRCLPFPIAGAYVNSLYNEQGFYTAYNLLPKEYQEFDSELDHSKRHKLALESLKYLNNNLELFETDEFKEYVNHNQVSFHTKDVELSGIERLYNIIVKEIDIIKRAEGW